jgi:hypothetical protein
MAKTPLDPQISWQRMLNRAARRVVDNRQPLYYPDTIYGNAYVFQHKGKNYLLQMQVDFTALSMEELPYLEAPPVPTEADLDPPTLTDQIVASPQPIK